MKNCTRMSFVSAFVFIITAVFFSVNVNAVTTSCTFGADLFPGGDAADLTTSTACIDSTFVNDTEANIAAMYPLFGLSDWVLADKSDGPEGDHMLILSEVVNSGSSGVWSIADFKGYTSVFLTIKASSGFAAFLLNTAFTSGEWTTADLFPSGGGGKDLSHMSLYYSPGSLTVIPLPAALPLYGAGLALMGLLGFYRRRKLV